jgi:hypothetical protein
MDRVLIITLFAEDWWVTHQATELEIAQTHIDTGDQVTILGCDQSIGACNINQKSDPEVCAKCLKMRRKGYDLIDGDFDLSFINDFSCEEDLLRFERSSQSRDFIESFQIDGDPIGVGVISTLIWWSRDAECENSSLWEYADPLLVGSVRTYLAVKRFLEASIQYDKIYVFNGRMDIVKAAFLASIRYGHCTVFTHERGANPNRYSLFPNSTPHNRSLIHQQAKDLWEGASDSDDRNAVARSFFEARFEGQDTSWLNYLEKQEKGVLPVGFDSSIRNIAIFNSSEDEIASLGKEWQNPIYEFQSIGIERIVRDVAVQDPTIHFYLRVHPNLRDVSSAEMDRIKNLSDGRLSNLTVVRPDSSVCSYALLDACDATLTFCSTIGVEATFRRKPSILAGHAFYEDFNSSYNAKTHDEVIQLILTRDLAPKTNQGALLYGFYCKTRGIPFRYWSPSGLFEGKFKGESLKIRDAHPLKIRSARLKRFLFRTKKTRSGRRIVKVFGVMVYRSGKKE